MSFSQFNFIPEPVGPEKLLAIADASVAMMESILLKSDHITFQTIVNKTLEIFKIEACTLFLTPDDSTDYVVLAAIQTSKLDYKSEPRIRIEVRSDSGGGLTAHLANQHTITLLDESGLASSPFLVKRTPRHLESGRYWSVMGLPLLDRKGWRLGLLKLDNKKDILGRCVAFSRQDLEMATELTKRLVPVIEDLRLVGAVRDFLGHITPNLAQIARSILQKSQALVHADRGDVAFWDEHQQELVLADVSNAREWNVRNPVPEPSIVQNIWKNNSDQFLLLPDVTQEEYRHVYYPTHPDTRSELAIRFQLCDRKLGVLNLESFKPDFFDEKDVRILKVVSHYASIAVSTLLPEINVRAAVQLAVEDALPPGEALDSVLRSIRAAYGFTSGLIYSADHLRGHLRIVGYIDLPEFKKGKDLDVFIYSFQEKSLATYVFNKQKAYFSTEPSIDENVGQAGRNYFQIEGPLVGVPLLFGEKALGALVVWSRTAPSPTAEHKDLLKPFACLAAASIALAGPTELGITMPIPLQNILTSIVPKGPPQVNLLAILTAVRAIRFDRVRLFRYEPDTNTFVGIESLGMDNPEHFRDYVISIDRNPYSKHTADTALTNPVARIYDPRHRDFQHFGQDPDGFGLAKPENLQWAVVPLVADGRLYGQIVADNFNTGHAITDDALAHMTFVGALAALTLSYTDNIELVSKQQRSEALVLSARAVAHRLRNVLAPVSEYLNRIIRWGEITDEVRDWSQKALQEARSAQKTVSDFDSFARSQVFERADILSASELVRRLGEDAEKYRLGTDVTIEYHPASALLSVRVNLQRLRDDFANFVLDSMRHKPVGLRVAITCEATSAADVRRLKLHPGNEYLKLIYSDNGPGVPENLKERVFESFFSTMSDGTGLGLAIAKHNAAVHGGAILECGQYGSGVRFELFLPAFTSETGRHEIHG